MLNILEFLKMFWFWKSEDNYGCYRYLCVTMSSIFRILVTVFCQKWAEHYIILNGNTFLRIHLITFIFNGVSMVNLATPKFLEPPPPLPTSWKYNVFWWRKEQFVYKNSNFFEKNIHLWEIILRQKYTFDGYNYF